MKFPMRGEAVPRALLFCWLLALAGLGDAGQQLEVTAPQKLLALRQVRPLGEVALLEAVRVGGDRPIWATVGYISLARVRGRVFRSSGSGGFSAQLILGGAEDARALASANGVAACQIVRLPLGRIECEARVQLPARAGDSLPVLRVPGASAADPSSEVGTVVVHFNATLNEAALGALESGGGEVTCRLRSAGGAPPFSRTVQLRASRAVRWAPELETAAPAGQSWPCLPVTDGTSDIIDLAAVYNFRSEWGADNLVDSGRYRVTPRGGARFTMEGAELPGNSWLEIDTENGSLTKHMDFDSRWSVFLMFRRSDTSRRRAALFSVHRAGNRLASSILAWTTGPGQAAVYGRVHNLAAGFAVGQATRPALDRRPGAWNRVGIAYDGGGRLSVAVNGAVAGAGPQFTFPSYASSTPDGLRTALSLGLVRAPELALVGALRCFGVARGSLRPEQFSGLFNKYCQ